VDIEKNILFHTWKKEASSPDDPLNILLYPEAGYAEALQ
jgi:hypothetical protein